MAPTRSRVLAIRDTTELLSLMAVVAQDVLRAPLGGTSLRQEMGRKLQYAQSQALATALQWMARAAVQLQVQPLRSHAARVRTIQTTQILSQNVSYVQRTRRALPRVLLVHVMRAIMVLRTFKVADLAVRHAMLVSTRVRLATTLTDLIA